MERLSSGGLRSSHTTGLAVGHHRYSAEWLLGRTANELLNSERRNGPRYIFERPNVSSRPTVFSRIYEHGRFGAGRRQLVSGHAWIRESYYRRTRHSATRFAHRRRLRTV